MLDVLSRTVTRVRLPGAAAAVGTDHAHAPHRSVGAQAPTVPLHSHVCDPRLYHFLQ